MRYSLQQTKHHYQQPRAFSLKSVVDFGDGGKNDQYQKYAAFTSAQALKHFRRRVIFHKSRWIASVLCSLSLVFQLLPNKKHPRLGCFVPLVLSSAASWRRELAPAFRLGGLRSDGCGAADLWYWVESTPNCARMPERRGSFIPSALLPRDPVSRPAQAPCRDRLLHECFLKPLRGFCLVNQQLLSAGTWATK